MEVGSSAGLWAFSGTVRFETCSDCVVLAVVLVCRVFATDQLRGARADLPVKIKKTAKVLNHLYDENTKY